MPRISQLPSLTTADNADEIAIVDVSASTTKKITRGDLLKSPLPTNSVTTAAVTNGAITASKLDFTTLRAELFANQSTSASQFATLTMTSTLPTGLYFIIAQGSPNFNNSSGDATFTLQVNGAYISSTVVSRSSSYWEQVVLTGIATVATGHVVRTTGTSSNPDGNNRNYLRMFRIG